MVFQCGLFRLLSAGLLPHYSRRSVAGLRSQFQFTRIYIVMASEGHEHPTRLQYVMIAVSFDVQKKGLKAKDLEKIN